MLKTVINALATVAVVLLVVCIIFFLYAALSVFAVVVYLCWMIYSLPQRFGKGA